MKRNFSLLFILVSCIILVSCLSTENIKTAAPIEGKWLRPDTKTSIVIVKDSVGYKLQSVIDDDGEVYIVTKTEMKDNTFYFSWKVPSTGYVNNFFVLSCTESILTVQWSGTAGVEKEFFIRKK